MFSSLSLRTLLLKGDDKLPGFDVMGEVDLLWEELLHVWGSVHVFTLQVRQQCVFQALGDKTKTFNANNFKMDTVSLTDNCVLQFCIFYYLM